MTRLLALGASVLLLAACAPAPVSSDTASAEATSPADGDGTPQASAAVELESQTPTAEGSDGAYAVPPVNEATEAGRAVATADNPATQDRTFGPRQLTEEFTLSAQCAVADEMTVHLYDISTASQGAEPGSERDALASYTFECGEVQQVEVTGVEGVNGVQIELVADAEAFDGWAVIDNGVG